MGPKKPFKKASGGGAQKTKAPSQAREKGDAAVKHGELFTLECKSRCRDALSERASANKWLENLSIDQKPTMGEIANLLIGKEVFIPLEPVVPAGNVNEIARQKYLLEFKIWTAKNDERLRHAGQIIAVGMQHLSDEMRDLVGKDYPNHDSEGPGGRDLAMFRASVIKCQGGYAHKTKKERQDDCDAALVDFRKQSMKPGTTLKAHFDCAERLFKEIEDLSGVQIPEADKTDDIVSSLNSEYTKFKEDRRSTKIAGVGMPTGTAEERAAKARIEYVPCTVETLYQQLLLYQPTTGRKANDPLGEVLSQLQLAAVDKAVKKKLKAVGKEEKSKSKESSEKAEETSTTPMRPCIHCGGEHWNRDCPYKADIEAFIAEKKKLAGSKWKGGGGERKDKSPDVSAAALITRSEAFANRRELDDDYDDDDDDDEQWRDLLMAAAVSAATADGTNWEQLKYPCVLDNCGANTTIHHKDLCSKIRTTDGISIITATGIGQLNRTCISKCFGKTYFDDNMQFSILNRTQMEMTWRVYDFKYDGVTVKSEIRLPNGVVLVFNCNGRVMIGDLEPLVRMRTIKPPPEREVVEHLAIQCTELPDIEPSSENIVILDRTLRASSAAASADGTAFTMSKKMSQQIETARLAQRNMGYMSQDDMRRVIASGDVFNAPVDPGAARRADDILGSRSREILKGKTHTNTSHPSLKLEDKLQDGQLAMHMDLMKCQKGWYLIGVSEPGSYTYQSYLGRQEEHARRTENLIKPITSMFAYLSALAWTIKFAIFDGEGAFSKLSTLMQTLGAITLPQPKGAGLPIVDNKIRVIKQRIRCIRAGLAFVASALFCVYLVSYVVKCITFAPTRSNIDNISPYKFITRGDTLDYQKVFNVGFGDYCEVHANDRIQSNSVEKERTISAIFVDNIDTDGTKQFINLKTLKPFRRHHFHGLPTPPGVIDILNRAADIIGTGDDDDDDSTDAVPDEPSIVEQPDPTPDSDSASPIPPATMPIVGVEAEPRIPVVPARARESPEQELASAVPSEFSPTPLRRSERTNRGINTRLSYASLTNPSLSFATQMATKKAIRAYGSAMVDASLLEEIRGMVIRKVWSGVHVKSLSPEERRRVIRSSVFFKLKYKDGAIDRLKARLVAGGDQQDKTIYDESIDISSPTVSTTSVFSIVATAAAKKHHIMTFDIGQAYLNADIKEVVLVRLDPISAQILCQIDAQYSQYVLKDNSMIVKLNKALYGCVESARLWYEHLKSVMFRIGYLINPLDQCVFNKLDSESNVISTVCFHVDDGLATSPLESELDILKREMIKEFKEVKFSEGKVHEYLGMKLDFSTDFETEVTTVKYIVDILTNVDIGMAAAPTPASASLFDIDVDSPALSIPESKAFHTLTAQCLYLSVRVRPDILCSVSFLCTRVRAPTEQDRKKLHRLLRYLRDTKHLGVKIGGGPDGCIQLCAWVDASFGVHFDGKSHTGMFISLGRGPILAKSQKQRVVSKSSAEAELIGTSDISSLLAWEQDFMSYQGYKDEVHPATLHEDNTSAIHLAKNGRSTSDRTRHIKLRYFFVKQFLDNGQFVMNYRPTDYMTADILTKPLQGDLFTRLRDLLLGYAI